jgi:hypothetical protein
MYVMHGTVCSALCVAPHTTIYTTMYHTTMYPLLHVWRLILLYMCPLLYVWPLILLYMCVSSYCYVYIGHGAVGADRRAMYVGV